MFSRTARFISKVTNRPPRKFVVASRFDNTRSFSADNFLNGANATYAEEMYKAYQQDPTSVHPSWAAYFKTGSFQEPGSAPVVASSGGQEDSADAVKMFQMVRAFQVWGHLIAELDPLGLLKFGADRKQQIPSYLEFKNWGWTDAHRDKKIYVGGMKSTRSSEIPPVLRELSAGTGYVTIGEVYDRMKERYSGKIGYEFMHIMEFDKCQWLREEIEVAAKPFSKEESLDIMERLMWGEHFEKFLNKKYPAQKRFGLDGAETMIPCLKAAIDQAADDGIEKFVIGMPHRGRLNVLSTVVRKPLRQIFNEFSGLAEPGLDEGSGDVKYHLGVTHDRQTKSGKQVTLSLLPNPSHLEAVNPLVLGKTRAKMHYMNDPDGSKVAPLLIHGDAAFAGQGINAECFSFSDLPNYATGGTIHVVVNNQIGFTTDTFQARSSPYCTDVAKIVGCPIFHVNGDDPEAVVRAARLASRYRNKWKQDVVIDLICYRKFGHNEGDEPKFTQPVMYKTIEKHENVINKFKASLLQRGIISEEVYQAMSDRIFNILADEFQASRDFSLPAEESSLKLGWEGYKAPHETAHTFETTITDDQYSAICKAILNLPENLNIHPRLKKIWAEKNRALTEGTGIDWGTAEQLAIGSLLTEGVHVRYSGQDVERGTFSHRHAVLHEQKDCSADNRPTYRPLCNIDTAKAEFTVSNSNLSEYGVCGFELGYSLENPSSLVVWEAQFGDFSNGSQIIFDQFMSSQEAKWRLHSGFCVFLPHGYEGGGPEHSSSRVERFLQMSADHPHKVPPEGTDPDSLIQNNNWQVLQCSTPANFFHAMRRQVNRDYRKPAVFVNPKSLLKLRACVSEKEDFMNDRFHRVLPANTEEIGGDGNAKRVIFTSGKAYYDLKAERDRLGLKNVVFSRLEQLAPFPFVAVEAEVRRFPNAEFMWAQEEPMNMGAYTYIAPRFEALFEKLNYDQRKIKYAGRPPRASPATGFPKVHKQEEADIRADSFADL